MFYEAHIDISYFILKKTQLNRPLKFDQKLKDEGNLKGWKRTFLPILSTNATKEVGGKALII